MATSPSASEIVTLLMIVLLVPLTLTAGGRMRIRGALWLNVGFFAIVLAAILAWAEHIVGGQVTTDIKNVVYALAGIAYAVGMWQLRSALRSGA